MPNKCLLHEWVNVTLNYCKTSFFITLETSQPSTKSYLKNHWNINDTEGKKDCGGVGELHLPDFSIK